MIICYSNIIKVYNIFHFIFYRYLEIISVSYTHLTLPTTPYV